MKDRPVTRRFLERRFCWWVLLLGLAVLSSGQALWSQTAPQEGIRRNTPQVHALVNARIVPGPGQLIDQGTIILRDGNIEAVGAGVAVPASELPFTLSRFMI